MATIWAWPLRGLITTTFRETGPYWAQGYHTGVDVAAPIGSPVRACADGVVVEAETTGHNGGYGSYVKVDHGGGVISIYGHLSTVRVDVGQVVSVGEVIGAVGMTGNTTGPHLHWEVRRGGSIVDPLGFLP
jgi:murein DD-endopeptidase MepM/ murein hydrolase activator NlpD